MERIPVMPMLFPDSPKGTTLWASESVFDWLHGMRSADERRRHEGKLQFFCDSNFRLFMPETIKREHGKTYGIHVGQFRVAGFFDKSYQDFIAVDCFIKKKQRNDQRMNALYENVDRIREAGLWIRQK